MKATKIPYLKNWLAGNRSLADRVEDGKHVADLLEHPGWAVILERAETVAANGERKLTEIAQDTAMSGDIQARIDFARKRGVQDAVAFFPDVIETILDSARHAASDLKADAEKASAGGS